MKLKLTDNVLFWCIGLTIPAAYFASLFLYDIQDYSVLVYRTPVTFAWLIGFVLWGVISDRFSKRMSKSKGWALYLAGTLILLWAVL